MSFEFGNKQMSKSRTGERSRSKHGPSVRKTPNSQNRMVVQLQSENQNFVSPSPNIDQMTPQQDQQRRLDFVNTQDVYETPSALLHYTNIQANHDNIRNLTPYSSSALGDSLRGTGKLVVESQASRKGPRRPISALTATNMSISSMPSIGKSVPNGPNSRYSSVLRANNHVFQMYDASRSEATSEYGQFLQHVEFRGVQNQKKSVFVDIPDDSGVVEVPKESAESEHAVKHGENDAMQQYLETGHYKDLPMTRQHLLELVDQEIRQVQTQVWRKDREQYLQNSGNRSVSHNTSHNNTSHNNTSNNQSVTSMLYHPDQVSDTTTSNHNTSKMVLLDNSPSISSSSDSDNEECSESEVEYDPVDSMDLMTQVQKDVKLHNTRTRKQMQQAYAQSKVYRIAKDKSKRPPRQDPNAKLAALEGITSKPMVNINTLDNVSNSTNASPSNNNNNNANHPFRRYTLINGSSFLPFHGVMLHETGLWRQPVSKKKGNASPPHVFHYCIIVPLARVLSVEINSKAKVQAYISTSHIDHTSAKLEQSRNMTQRVNMRQKQTFNASSTNTVFQEGILPPLVPNIIALGETHSGPMVLSGRGEHVDHQHACCSEEKRVLGETHMAAQKRITNTEKIDQSSVQIVIPRKSLGYHDKGYASTRAACHVCLFLTIDCKEEFVIKTYTKVSVGNQSTVTHFHTPEEATTGLGSANTTRTRSSTRGQKAASSNLAKSAPALYVALEQYRADPMLRDEFIYNMQKKYHKFFRHQV